MLKSAVRDSFKQMLDSGFAATDWCPEAFTVRLAEEEEEEYNNTIVFILMKSPSYLDLADQVTILKSKVIPSAVLHYALSQEDHTSTDFVCDDMIDNAREMIIEQSPLLDVSLFRLTSPFPSQSPAPPFTVRAGQGSDTEAARSPIVESIERFQKDLVEDSYFVYVSTDDKYPARMNNDDAIEANKITANCPVFFALYAVGRQLGVNLRTKYEYEDVGGEKQPTKRQRTQRTPDTEPQHCSLKLPDDLCQNILCALRITTVSSIVGAAAVINWGNIPSTL